MEQKRKNFVTDILKKILPIMGATLLVEPEYEYTGLITFANGKKMYYRDTRFNINPLGSVELTRDKRYTSYFLEYFGYNVPEGQTFFSEEWNRRVEVKRTIGDGCLYAEHLGFPVILKPNNFSQGALVTKVYDREEYFEVAKQIVEKTNVFLVERFYEGNDYRVVVLDGKVISAYQRIPLLIEGDGERTIEELLLQKKEEYARIGRGADVNPADYRIQKKLKRRELTLKSILQKHEVVSLLDNANLSTGGTSFEFTDRIHPDYSDLAVRVAKTLELRLAGVDILTEDITKPLSDYIILEVNSAPGLDNYASMGEVQMKKVEDLYRQILQVLEKS